MPFTRKSWWLSSKVSSKFHLMIRDRTLFPVHGSVPCTRLEFDQERPSLAGILCLRFSRCSEGLKVLTGGPLGTARYQGPRRRTGCMAIRAGWHRLSNKLTSSHDTLTKVHPLHHLFPSLAFPSHPPDNIIHCRHHFPAKFPTSFRTITRSTLCHKSQINQRQAT